MENNFQHLTAVEVQEYNTTKSKIDSIYDRMDGLNSEVGKLLREELRSKGIDVSDKSYADTEEKEDAFVVDVNISECFMRGKEFAGEFTATIYNRKYYWSHSGIIKCEASFTEDGQTKFDFNHGSGGTNSENRLETIKVAANAFQSIALIGEHVTANHKPYYNLVKEFVAALKESREEGVKLEKLRKLNEQRENDSLKDKFMHIFQKPTSEDIKDFIDNYNTQAGVILGSFNDYNQEFVLKRVRIDKYTDDSGRTRFQTSGLKDNSSYSRTSRKDLEEALEGMLILNGKPMTDISELLGEEHSSHYMARVPYEDMTKLARSIDTKKLINEFENHAKENPQQRRKI